jgi:Bacteriophage tail assembly protein
MPLMADPILQSILRCPHCGHSERLSMPTEACVFFHECAACHAIIRPKPGDCCVFCSFGSEVCPPMQGEVHDDLAERGAKRPCQLHSVRRLGAS